MIDTNDLKLYKEKSRDFWFKPADINNPKYTVLPILDDNGWIQFYKHDDYFVICTMYIKPEIEYDKAKVFEDLKGMARLIGCKKIVFNTMRNPKVWERAFGFHVIGYMMEGDL